MKKQERTMKKLSAFKGEKGIEIAADVLDVVLRILAEDKNKAAEGETKVVKMFTTFMRNSPAEMNEIFAILSEKDPSEYECDGAEAMTNMLILANDPVMVQLFFSPEQSEAEKGSGSGSENTEAPKT